MIKKRSKKDTYYNSISNSYNELYGEEQKKKMQIILKYLPKKPKQKSILDVGCGSGLSTPKNQIGIDPSEELIKLHKGYNKIKKKSHAFVGNAEDLPFKNEQFEYVISVTALHHCNIKKALNEIKRVVKSSEKKETNKKVNKIMPNIVLSILKEAKNFEQIGKEINKVFKVNEKIDEGKDVVFVLHD